MIMNNDDNSIWIESVHTYWMDWIEGWGFFIYCSSDGCMASISIITQQSGNFSVRLCVLYMNIAESAHMYVFVLLLLFHSFNHHSPSHWEYMFVFSFECIKILCILWCDQCQKICTFLLHMVSVIISILYFLFLGAAEKRQTGEGN